MIAYTLQVNKPSAYSLQSRSSQRQFLCILYSVGNESGSPFQYSTGRLREKGMEHTAQARLLSLSVPNVFTQHAYSASCEFALLRQCTFWQQERTYLIKITQKALLLRLSLHLYERAFPYYPTIHKLRKKPLKRSTPF